MNNPGNLFPTYDLPPITADNFVGTTPVLIQPTPTPPLSLLSQVATFFRPRNQYIPPPIQENSHFGDLMPVPIPESTTRMYFINLNGINIDQKANKFRDLCKELRKADVQIFAAAEHNLDTNKFVVRQKLDAAARQTFPHHCLQTATSSIPAEKCFKPGGTLLLAQGDIVGRIKDRGSDSLSRWAWMKLVGQDRQIITVISAYQVCVQNSNGSGTTAYHQQESLLRQRGTKKAKPHKFFHRDLKEFI